MTTSFFAPPEARSGDWISLPEEEARHAAKVLRKRAGEEIVVVDGIGGWHRVRLETVEKRQVAGVIVETRREVGEPACPLCIALAPLKNHNRYETFVEKAVELGVTEIVPLLTVRTEAVRLREARLHGLLIAAMKQSGRSRSVSLTAPHSLAEVLAHPDPGLRLLCHEQADPGQALLDVLADEAASRPLQVLVGPEGGFSDEEVDTARQAGARIVSLGPRRLRAETAGIAAAAAVMLARR